jgi:NADH:ubiquinone oxidoreductase subunit 3 (subunit A)
MKFYAIIAIAVIAVVASLAMANATSVLDSPTPQLSDKYYSKYAAYEAAFSEKEDAHKVYEATVEAEDEAYKAAKEEDELKYKEKLNGIEE